LLDDMLLPLLLRSSLSLSFPKRVYLYLYLA
jgi:hypothetical protein